MQSWKRFGFVAVAAVFAITGGVAWAKATGSGPPVRPGPMPVSNPEPEDIGGGITESKSVAIAPCRIVDTRLAGGVVAAGSTRTFAVRGSGAKFAAQGGKANGCGVAGAATSVEATITAVGPTGAGFLRAWPTNQSEPTATFLNYSGPNISSTGNLAVCNSLCSGGDLKVQAASHATHVVIDVVGYSVKPLAARIASDGSIVLASRVASVTHDNVGNYHVTFDRNIEKCVPTATVWNTGRVTALIIGAVGARLDLYIEDTASPYPGIDAGFSVVEDC